MEGNTIQQDRNEEGHPLMKPLLIVLALLLVSFPAASSDYQNRIDNMKVAEGLTRAVHYATIYGEVDWETLNAKEGIKRRVGLCSQRSFILNDVMDIFGISARSYSLGGHVVTLAKIDGIWIVCDPSYDVIVPKSITEIESDPSIVEPYYGKPMPVFGRVNNRPPFRLFMYARMVKGSITEWLLRGYTIGLLVLGSIIFLRQRKEHV